MLRAFGSAPILFISQQNLLQRRTNWRAALPNSGATDVSAGWRLMKISSKPSVVGSSGGLPGFISSGFTPADQRYQAAQIRGHLEAQTCAELEAPPLCH